MQRRGFTLIELIVVVFIIALVYGLAIRGIQRGAESHTVLTLPTVVDFLKPYHKNNHVALICTDNCDACGFYIDDRRTADIEPFIDAGAEYYRYDYYTGADIYQPLPLFDDEGYGKEVCFRFDIFEDGSQTEMMVKYRDQVVDFPGFFGRAHIYDSLDDAISAKEALIDKVRK